jgi:hypothetical protein
MEKDLGTVGAGSLPDGTPLLRPQLADVLGRSKSAAISGPMILGIVAFVLQNPVLTPLGVGLAYYWYRRRRRGRGIVLWLRRFNRPEERRFRFERSIQAAVAGTCTPVTVQDHTFKRSLSDLSIYVALVISLVGLFLLLMFLRDDMFVIGAMAVLLGIFFAFVAYATAGFYSVTPAANLDRLINRMRSGRGPLSGTLILRCHESNWQSVVRRMIRNAHIVIADVTTPSANVLWEISTALRHLAPESVALAFGTNEPLQSAPHMSTETAGLLERHVGREAFGRMHQIAYPARIPFSLKWILQSQRRKPYERVAIALRAAMSMSISVPFE